MIRKLRRKFIAIAMGSLFAVMLVLVGTINIANFTRVNASLDRMLGILCDNGGAMPDFGTSADAPNEPPNSAQSDAQNDNDAQGDAQSAVQGDAQNSGFTPETTFRTRYFYVRINSDGEVESVNTDKIASVTQEEAEELALEAASSGKTEGYRGVYKYRIVQTADGGTLVVYLNCESELQNLRSMLIISAGAGLLSCAAVFVLVVIFSGRAIRPIAESIEKQKRFITDAGHELKTPLTIVSSNAELIELDCGPSEWLDGIKKQVARLTALVNSLVMLSRLDEEQPAADFARFDFSAAVSDTASAFASAAERRGVAFSLDVEDALFVRGDEAQLRKLVSVLTDNAVKYCDEKGAVGVRLSGTKHPRLEVSNTYAGASSLDLHKVFDRFYRADESRSRKSGSYGLGLSIARSIAETHGAKLWAESAADTVTFIFQISA